MVAKSRVIISMALSENMADSRRVHVGKPCADHTGGGGELQHNGVSAGNVYDVSLAARPMLSTGGSPGRAQLVLMSTINASAALSRCSWVHLVPTAKSFKKSIIRQVRENGVADEAASSSVINKTKTNIHYSRNWTGRKRGQAKSLQGTIVVLKFSDSQLAFKKSNIHTWS